MPPVTAATAPRVLATEQLITRWSLAARVGAQMSTIGVRYCAWKGDPKVGRFERGAGDLDLLVDRHQLPALIEALGPLGFRLVLPPSPHVAPGVHSFVAPNPQDGTLVHVHVHLQLLAGPSDGTQYHLPWERAVLASARWADGLRVPSAEIAFLLHVVHQTLRHTLRAALRRREPSWLLDAEPTLAELERRCDIPALREALARHLPGLPPSLFAACVEALRPRGPRAARLLCALRLRLHLRAHRRSAGALSWLSRLGRTLGAAVPGRAPRSAGRGRPAAGGVVIALVGGDGAGKSTCAMALLTWLGSIYDVRHAHLGRPPRGLLTLACGTALKGTAWLRRRTRWRTTASLHAHAELSRVVCTARDRARLHARIHRHAARGGVVICERHPASEHEALAGPSDRQGMAGGARSRVATWLRRYERVLYARLARPDLTLVLRVAPEVAVRRKPEEPAEYVRRRAQLVWMREWDAPDERAVNAGRPLQEVVRELQQRVWELL